MDTFSERLKKLISTKNITPSELSRISGISKSSISHYLKGDWTAKQDAIHAIAKATLTNEAWLMGYDNAPMQKLFGHPFSTDDTSLSDTISITHSKTGDKIKHLRESLNLTQEELAKMTGYTSKTSISKIESGLVDLSQSKIMVFAKALKVNPSYLMECVDDNLCSNSIGQRIKTRRDQLGLAQKEVATYVSVSEATISRWESGIIANMGADKIVSLAKILQMTPSQLIGWGDKPECFESDFSESSLQPPSVHPTFASNLQALRVQRGWTQDDLADLLSVSRSTVGMYETGKREPDLESLLSLATIFHVTVDSLLGSIQPPSDLQYQLLNIFEEIPNSKKEYAIELLKTFSDSLRE